MSRDIPGSFEILILLSVLRLGEQAYGATILQELEQRTQRQISAGAVYVVLKRLERKGLIATKTGGSSPERGGRPRRIVTLRPDGIRAVRNAHSEWGSMTAGLETLLETEG